ncbi:leucine-rich repeat domain-containing protein [Nonomuraea helvata]|uniref:Leucine-rich repeat domain-containing protein n=1 Tax=Nonomuraea helvata TaxID=37484 RepID=A0ABV5SGA0_9ACTN
MPAEIARLTRLETLEIRCRYIAVLPPEIGHLARLRELTACGTALTELPAEIGELQQLEVLDLQSAPLKAFPAELGRLGALRRLLLNGHAAVSRQSCGPWATFESWTCPTATWMNCRSASAICGRCDGWT